MRLLDPTLSCLGGGGVVDFSNLQQAGNGLDEKMRRLVQMVLHCFFAGDREERDREREIHTHIQVMSIFKPLRVFACGCVCVCA